MITPHPSPLPQGERGLPVPIPALLEQNEYGNTYKLLGPRKSIPSPLAGEG